MLLHFNAAHTTQRLMLAKALPLQRITDIDPAFTIWIQAVDRFMAFKDW